jgi:phage-Barnase-EndoU-ColicinE5/D-RelE like nuclease3
LFDACLEEKGAIHQRLDLFIVPETLVLKILKATGIDVKEHWVSIDNYDILHALEHHGNLITEARRGQIALEKEDFCLYLDVFLHPDVIKTVGVTRRTSLPVIQFEKWIDGKHIVVKEVRTITSVKKNKISRLVFHTMYKIKKSSK